ncbi:MAG: hypothetical protein HQL17_08360 [Candidatus Omnitrophica bacterium]|nr:hypothetical protein [Candidatus Omnitrophota bacterium]
MDVLLILKSRNGDVKMMVSLSSKEAEARVLTLLQHNRIMAAFDLLKEEAEVRKLFTAGTKLSAMPDLTLVEELIADA